MADEAKTESTDIGVKEIEEALPKTSPAKSDAVTNGKSAENGTSANTETDPEAIKKEATMLFLQGKRHLIIRDYQLAVEALSEAVQLFCQIYDDQADEMADPYFYYGKALFEIARNESDVLGDQVAKDEEKNDDEEDDIPEEDETEDGEKNDEEEKNESEAKPEDDGEAGGSKDEEAKEEESDEPVNDLQLSWEYLELAKLIYSRKADTCKETAIKLAEVYQLLGENGLESESYGTAIEDMKDGLALLEKHLPPEDRRIAEMCYHLGIAYSISENFDEAITHFQNANTHLQQKIDSLQKRIDTGDKKTEDEERDAFYTMEGEIDEIKAIIKEIIEKITDMNDYKRQVKDALVKQVFGGGASAGASSSSSNPSTSGEGSSSSSAKAEPAKPVTDISHLIRKKRKPETEESNPEKKAKVDEKSEK